VFMYVYVLCICVLCMYVCCYLLKVLLVTDVFMYVHVRVYYVHVCMFTMYLANAVSSRCDSVYVFIFQVLLVADDVEVRRLVLSANIVTEKVAILNSARTMAAVLDNFQVTIANIVPIYSIPNINIMS
jgi:hypothetical protein